MQHACAFDVQIIEAEVVGSRSGISSPFLRIFQLKITGIRFETPETMDGLSV